MSQNKICSLPGCKDQVKESSCSLCWDHHAYNPYLACVNNQCLSFGPATAGISKDITQLILGPQTASMSKNIQPDECVIHTTWVNDNADYIHYLTQCGYVYTKTENDHAHYIKQRPIPVPTSNAVAE
jgi:hypothetical protein